jgi:hypothetical protein
MTTNAIPAGWYPDPLDAGASQRFWDGDGWTAQTGPTLGDAMPQQMSSPQQQPVTPPSAPQQQQVTPPSAPQMSSFQSAYQSYRDPYARDHVYSPYRGSGRGPGWSTGPPRTSTGVKVLIGVGIAVGVLFVIVVLAAIAIPVALNQHAKAVATSAGSAANPSPPDLPELAVGLHQLHGGTTVQQTQRVMAIPAPGARSVAVYATPAGVQRAVVILGRPTMNATDAAKFLEVPPDLAKSTVTGMHAVDPGAFGGTTLCGVLSGRHTICTFVDPGGYGTIDIFGTTSGAEFAMTLRRAVEHGSN